LSGQPEIPKEILPKTRTKLGQKWIQNRGKQGLWTGAGVRGEKVKHGSNGVEGKKNKFHLFGNILCHCDYVRESTIGKNERTAFVSLEGFSTFGRAS